MKTTLLVCLVSMMPFLPTWGSNSKKPLDCEEWSVHGYRIGMSIEEASKLREMKERGDGYIADFLQTLHSARLLFDDQGLVYYRAQLPQKMAFSYVGGELSERFGVQTGQFYWDQRDLPGKKPDFISAVWINEECDSMVAIQSKLMKHYERPVIWIFLVRLSDYREREANEPRIPATR